MAKLYPPVIAGTIPAFCGTSIEVPFSMNRAVGISEFNGFALKIKKVSGSLVGTIVEKDAAKWLEKRVITFKLPEQIVKELRAGEFYKIQIAYVDKTNQIGYYSSIGIIKYTSIPSLEIPGLSTNFYGKYDYVGIYSREDEDITQTNPETGEVTILESIKRDNTEKCFSYCFELTDRDGNLVATSGTQLHDASTD
mgnify:CR=1 FL=1